MINKIIADITLAAAGNLDSFAETVPPDPLASTRALTLFSSTTNSQVRTMCRHDPTVAKQFYVLFQNKITILTRPTTATDTNLRPVYLASLGDQLDIPFPVRIPAQDFDGYFVTLASRSNATLYNLPTSMDNPVVLDGPPGENTPAPGLQRIHWPPINEVSEGPAIVALPLAALSSPANHSTPTAPSPKPSQPKIDPKHQSSQCGSKGWHTPTHTTQSLPSMLPIIYLSGKTSTTFLLPPLLSATTSK